MTADDCTEAVYRSFESFASKMPGGWSRRAEDSVVFVTGLPIPTLNGVITGSTDLSPATVNGLLDEVAASGLPYCLEFPAGAVGLTALAGERGLHRDDDIPLMRLDTDPIHARPSSVAVRRLAATEAMLHADIAARGFEAPVEVLAPLVTATASSPEVAIYIAEFEGEAVSTGLGVRDGESVGVCNIATPPEFRSRGYGAAVTAAIVNDAIAGGAKWAWLQSSAVGYNVYQRLGFRTVSTWECWIHS